MKSGPARFTSGRLEAVSKALADTETGLTGSEIARALQQIGVADPDKLTTKWKRLFNALAERQNHDGSGDRVLAFINASLEPSRYIGNRLVFNDRRCAVNAALAFSGLQYGEDGKFHRCVAASTLSEAEARADRLRTLLQQRNVDPEVLAFCRAELLQDNYFHAVLEATKSVADKLRSLANLGSDGADLVQQALGGTSPRVRINDLATETRRGEQRGFCNLLIGMFGMFRNPTAHAPKREWPMEEEDALDLLSLASYAHRRLRAARRMPEHT
jgi:uncharacterized protein (TIGR02391 family)